MREGEKKHERMRSILISLAAEFIQSVSNNTNLITVTGCDLSESERKAIILVSVLPETDADQVRAFLRRKRQAFKNYVKSHSKLRSIPAFDFQIDEGEKNRQRLDDLSKKI